MKGREPQSRAAVRDQGPGVESAPMSGATYPELFELTVRVMRRLAEEGA